MDPAQTRARSQPAPPFEDGFGRRQHVVSASKDPVEVLLLKREHLAVDGFEPAVRERIDQLGRFRHDGFVRVRGLARVAKADAGMALVSDRVEGTRLSHLLDPSQHRTLDKNAALVLIEQLLDALVAFHEAVPGCHGAIAAERIILRPDGRLMIAEPVFGTALSKLSLDPAHLWEQLQIAVPSGANVGFDQQTDLYQAGSLALALVLGRPLGSAYPNRVGNDSLSSVFDKLPDYVGKWISRAIQRRGHDPFSSAALARDAFAPVLSGIDRDAARLAILAFYSGEAVKAATPETVRPVATVAVPAPVNQGPSPTIVATQSATTPAKPAERPATSSMDADSVSDSPDAHQTPGAFGAAGPFEVVRRFFVPMTRRTIGATAAVLMLLTTGGAFAGKRYFSPATAPVEKGTLAVTTTPTGAAVVIDGQQRGHAPMTLQLAAGDHVLQVGLDGSSRTIPFKVTAGAQVSQVIDLPKAVAATGQLQIRTEPSGAKVMIDGQKRGTSPTTIEGLLPGVHMVTVEGQLGSVTQDVTIESGVTAALVVPLNAPQGAPVSGWIAVAAPIDVQIFEKGQLLGSSRSEKIMASIGRHDLDVANDALGYHVTRSVTVSPGQVSAIKVDPPKGSLSLNAVPWAEVWIDGERAGETPIGNVQLSIGQHEVIFRHPELGEQRFTPTVTLSAPARLSADLRRKP